MVTIKSILCAGFVAICANSAIAATVDFENESPLNPDPTLIAVGSSYVNGGITFTSTETMQLVGIGGPRNAFVPNDTPNRTASGAPADFGEVFLTGDFNSNTDMNLSFASTVDSISFDIVDIDGGRDDLVGEAVEEQFTFEFLNAGVTQGITRITSNDVKGNATVVTVSFSGLFDEVSIVGVTPRGLRHIGWGIDNINYTQASVVPLPAGGVLLLTALGGFATMRSRKRKS